MKSERISPFWVGGYQPFSAASSVNKDIKTWSVEGANIQFDRNESNAHESGSLAKDFDFTLDLDYDF